MSPLVILFLVIVYFGILFWVAYGTGKESDNESFFLGNRRSHWLLVAFGMVGTSLSGVTFVSVPGFVGKDGFGYLQVALGYVIGYFAVAYILLPIYYKLNLISIYGYLNKRLGYSSYQSGAWIFIVSRLVGSTARLYLVANILQVSVLNYLGVPFLVTCILIIGMIILYTYKGGVKTIVWTDTLQTTCMLLGLVICIFYILNELDISLWDSFSRMEARGYTKIWNTEIDNSGFFIKQILAGVFICITMTGVDQEMMQKSLSVNTLKNSQKNIITLSFIIYTVIGLFLFLGGLLYLYADKENISQSGDQLFPYIALHRMPPIISFIFVIALVSALFPSADGAMTALTSSLCIDIFNIQEKNWNKEKKESFRKKTHLLVALSFLMMIGVFKIIDNNSMIHLLLKLAGFTYGPLLGLFAFGIFTSHKIKDRWVPVICFLAPAISFVIDRNQAVLLGDFRIGLELIVLNGVFTFLGLWLIRIKKSPG
ncbi:MAG: sodium:solute symporter [Bergeyella sp.]|nr:sodium:solute symporter [Bergeyella sp.]